jgi:N-acyl-D-amino-acid deacylase
MFDLAIVNGIIVDSCQRRCYKGNIYSKNGKIAAISPLRYDAAEVVDADGSYIAPGFIDIHTHTEGFPKTAEMLMRQGVTTVVNGNCGLGQRDLGAFFERMRQEKFPLNQLQLCGATTLRERAGQTDAYSPMTEEQINASVKMLETDIEAGACGVSFGLEYVPGASYEEVKRLSQIAANRGKLVAVHTRSDCWQGLDALDEMINIAEETGASVQISHVVYQYGFGMMRQALDKIADAVASGIDISCDSGMYTSFATSIGSAVFDGGCIEKWGCDYSDLTVNGERLTEEKFHALRRNKPKTACTALIGVAEEIPMAFELPYMMVSSDAGVGEALSGDVNNGHPQDAATFPRFIRELVLERKQLTLPDAIARITLLPAERLGLRSNGKLTNGADADLVVFDLAKIREKADFPHIGSPSEPPDGINAVIVGGRLCSLIANQK